MHHDSRQSSYKLGQDNITPFGLDIHNPVFLISGLTIVLFILYALMLQEHAAALFGWLRPAITSTFDWFFLLSGNLFVIFALLLIFLPVGKVRLGGQDATPDFGYSGWFAMLFAAGMGIGLMYFGVSEPLSHYASSLGGTTVENGARTDWAPPPAAPRRRAIWPWPRPSSTGGCTRGRSTRWWPWRWRSSPTTTTCR